MTCLHLTRGISRKEEKRDRFHESASEEGICRDCNPLWVTTDTSSLFTEENTPKKEKEKSLACKSQRFLERLHIAVMRAHIFWKELGIVICTQFVDTACREMS